MKNNIPTEKEIEEILKNNKSQNPIYKKGIYELNASENGVLYVLYK